MSLVARMFPQEGSDAVGVVGSRAIDKSRGAGK
jgi:hypothetical protein